MDLSLNEEHAALRETVEDFARKEVAPVIGELYERGEFPYDLVAKMGAMGLFGLPVPEEYGGMGGDYFALCLALEELAPTSRSSGGCRRWRPGRSWAGSGSPRPAAAPTPAPPAPPPSWTATSG